MNSLISKILMTVHEYNKYRSPEATAHILKIENNDVVIVFEGPFCDTCGVVDWIEDFIYEAENFNIKLKLIDVRDIGTYRKLAIFRVLNNS